MIYGDIDIRRERRGHYNVYRKASRYGEHGERLGAVIEHQTHRWTVYNAQGQQVSQKPYYTKLQGAWALRG